MSDIRIISADGATTYYLVNTNGVPTAGGAATAATTTPYMIVDDDERWDITVAPQGTPWMAQLTDPPMVIEIAGSSHNNMVSLAQQLYRLANAASLGQPATLHVKPTNATSAGYFTLYGATLAPLVDGLGVNPYGAGATRQRYRMQWTRSAYAGRQSTPETALTFAMNNNTLNYAQLASGTGAGDLAAEGQPLNFSISRDTGGTNGEKYYWIATTAAVTPTTTTTFTGVSTLTTSSTTWQSFALAASFGNWATLINNTRLKVRLFARMSAASLASELRFTVSETAGATTDQYWISAAIPAQAEDGSAMLVFDSGPIVLDIPGSRNIATDNTFSIGTEVRSSDGTSVTCTITRLDMIYYYDCCMVTMPGLGQAIGEILNLSSFVETTNKPCLPFGGQRGHTTSGGVNVRVPRIQGRLPRYYTGCYIYILSADRNGLPDTGHAFTVTVTHAPLYRNLRGNG